MIEIPLHNQGTKLIESSFNSLFAKYFHYATINSSGSGCFGCQILLNKMYGNVIKRNGKLFVFSKNSDDAELILQDKNFKVWSYLTPIIDL